MWNSIHNFYSHGIMNNVIVLKMFTNEPHAGERFAVRETPIDETINWQ